MNTIYVAENNGKTYEGDYHEIAKIVGCAEKYVRNLACIGTKTKSGWMVRRKEGQPERENPRDRTPTQYIARNKDEDPILGTADEIAELIGCSVTWVRHMIRMRRIWNGWYIDPASPEQIRRMEAQWR